MASLKFKLYSAATSVNQSFDFSTGVSVPGVTTAAMQAIWAAGNYTQGFTAGTPSSPTPIPNDTNNGMQVYQGLSTQLVPNPPSTTTPWTFSTDQLYGGSSGTGVMSYDFAFNVDYPADYTGDPADWSAILLSVSSANTGTNKTVTKTPATSSYSIAAYTCSTAGGVYPWIPQGNNSYMCSGTNNITIVPQPNVATPQYSMDVPNTWTCINEAIYCLMDGTGTIRDVKYTNGTLNYDQLLPTGGTDAAAVALIASIASGSGVTMGPDDIGYMTVSSALGNVENPKIVYNDPFFNWDSVFDQTSFTASATNSSKSAYTIQGGSTPPVNKPAMAFTYPQNSGLTPEQLVAWIQWSYPPMNTRIPFQNYVFSVPDVIIRK